MWVGTWLEDGAIETWLVPGCEDCAAGLVLLLGCCCNEPLIESAGKLLLALVVALLVVTAAATACCPKALGFVGTVDLDDLWAAVKLLPCELAGITVVCPWLCSSTSSTCALLPGFASQCFGDKALKMLESPDGCLNTVA